MGRLAFASDPEVTSYKLELVASKLGVELDDAHDAAADVTATLDILPFLLLLNTSIPPFPDSTASPERVIFAPIN